MTEQEEIDILTKTLYFEAGSTQEAPDILLIGWVIRNRVNAVNSLGAKRFGSSYYEICTKPYQFSCWNSVKPEKIAIGNTVQWRISKAIAEYIFHAPSGHSPIPGVCFYYNPKICQPSWAKGMTVVSPDWKLDHIFLKG